MNKHTKAYFIIFLLVLSITLAGICLYIYTDRLPTSDDLFQQNIASQIIELPNGQQVQATVTLPQDELQGWIGAKLSDLTVFIRQNLQYDHQFGIYIHDTYLDSPAQVAGILPGDILVEINGLETLAVIPTLNLIASLAPGKSYPFTVFRQGKYLEYLVKIDKKMHSQSFATNFQ